MASGLRSRARLSDPQHVKPIGAVAKALVITIKKSSSTNKARKQSKSISKTKKVIPEEKTPPAGISSGSHEGPESQDIQIKKSSNQLPKKRGRPPKRAAQPINTSPSTPAAEAEAAEREARDLRTLLEAEDEAEAAERATQELRTAAGAEAEDLASRASTARDPVEIANFAEAIAAKFRVYGQNPPNNLEGMAPDPDRDGSIDTKADDTKSLTTDLKLQMLSDSNVELEPEDEPDQDLIKRINQDVFSTRGLQEKERRWRADIAKCRVEAENVFQKTIMMKSINRHRLHEFLDYGTEKLWHSNTPPSKTGRYMNKPKPDVAIGFRSKVLFPKSVSQKTSLSKELQRYLCPEMTSNRAFPFFMLEVKGSMSDINAENAKAQGLISATHALYNIWQFIKGNEELETEFFTKFRIFTAAANGATFWMRAHRAVKLSPGEGRVDEESDDYPLAYRFDTITQLEGGDYSQAAVRKLLENILAWTIPDLQNFLISAIQHALERERLQKTKKQVNAQRNELSSPSEDQRPFASPNTGPGDSRRSSQPSEQQPGPSEGKSKKRAAAALTSADKRLRQSQAPD